MSGGGGGGGYGYNDRHGYINILDHGHWGSTIRPGVFVADALGRYIRKQPPGDIETIIVDEFGFAALNRGRSYAALYSSGRQFSGSFDVPLRAGYYRLIISNKHSYLAGKSVTFTLGQGVQNQ